MKWVLLAAVWLSASVSLADDAGLASALIRGVDPIVHGELVSVRVGHIAALANASAEEVSSSLTDTNPKCGRYVQAVAASLNGVADSAGRAFDGSASKETFLARSRLHILVPVFFSLDALFRDGAEGGYGSLDRRQKISCEFKDRASVSRTLKNMVTELASFHREVLGQPGLAGFDEMSGRLLELGASKRAIQSRQSWGLLAAAGILSVVCWELAPTVARSVAMRFLGRVPGFYTNGRALFAIRTAALSAEGLAYWWADRALIGREEIEGPAIVPSWDEQMRDAEQLNSSPLDSPELYYVYFSQIKAQLAYLLDVMVREPARESPRPRRAPPPSMPETTIAGGQR